MNNTIKKITPYLLILLGLFILLFMGQAIVAGILLLLGIVLAVEYIWPEKWDADKMKSC